MINESKKNYGNYFVAKSSKEIQFKIQKWPTVLVRDYLGGETRLLLLSTSSVANPPPLLGKRYAYINIEVGLLRDYAKNLSLIILWDTLPRNTCMIILSRNLQSRKRNYRGSDCHELYYEQCAWFSRKFTMIFGGRHGWTHTRQILK